jgi:hypothetical protein
LTPDLIYRVVGAPRAAKFRSAEQYLDVAFTEHVNRGFPVTSQLLLASKRANRAAKRNRGPGKQAAALPLSRLGDLQQVDPFHSRGPAYPGRATRIASWRLLREIEAASAKPKHIRFEDELVHWNLPNSKTDLQALGCQQTHSCCCESDRNPICPVCDIRDQVHWVRSTFQCLGDEAPLFPTLTGAIAHKVGFAATFTGCAAYLGPPIKASNGAPLYTGHTGRATGAQHLACMGV